MANRRYQVFVSSTFRDLRQERLKVQNALMEMDCIPTAMEHFPSATDEVWTLVSRKLKTCDYYLVIIAKRYGSTTPDGTSYTEKEYDLAVDLQIPVLAFVHGELGNIMEESEDGDSDKKTRFRDFLRKVESRTVREWTTPNELATMVATSLQQSIISQPRLGWTRSVGGEVLTREQFRGLYNSGERDFRWARLKGVDLSGMTLDGADFSRADLEQTSFREASLRKAKFLRANMREADLISANLKGANLDGSNLWRALLSFARIDDASISGANLRDTTMAELDGQFSSREFALIDHFTFEKSAWNESNMHDWKEAKAEFVYWSGYKPKIIQVITSD